MSATQHDPLPWQARCRGRKIDFVSVLADGSFTEVGQIYLNEYKGKTVTPTRRENAKLVLVACNTHQAQLKALQTIEDAVRAGKLAPEPSLAREIQSALARVAEEEIKAEKAIKPAGTPCSQFWDSSPAYAPAPSVSDGKPT